MTNEEHYEAERDDYESCVKFIRELPQTWVPALLIHAIESAYERGILKPGGAASIAAKTERKIGKAADDEFMETIAKQDSQIGNLAMLVIRLARCLPAGHTSRKSALDYLAREGLMPSVLREG